MDDPYAHHPGLRGKIVDPESSLFRKMTQGDLVENLQAEGIRTDWFYTDEKREALRRDVLKDRHNSDLWVFGYGSLMWNPALRFQEVRRAHVPDHARRFILKDIYGGRGTVEVPGLMAALDLGAGCHGLTFRIQADDVEKETEILWRRESVGPAYHARFVKAQLSDQTVDALTFVADYAAEAIEPDMTRDQQLEYLVTGTGAFGSSMDYIEGIAEHFEILGIDDPDVTSLLQEAQARVAAKGS
ncbi:MAG: hypothetical protein GKR98_09765 [Boseongicola sp.]|nr:MAG: hypothetical protein GKR98_09765 [Boseongicola sp.]